MGVSWVFEVKENVRSIELAFEQAGGTLTNAPKSFKVDCTWYRPVVNNQISSFYVLHHSHYPESSFIISTTEENGAFRQGPKATSDQGFDIILGKLSADLAPDLAGRFELTGNEYRLKDFRLRVGTLSIGTAVKSAIVEIEYAASNVVHQCHGLIQEAVDLFFPGYSSNTTVKPEVLTRNVHPDNYYPIDTLGQYLEVFVNIRKRP